MAQHAQAPALLVGDIDRGAGAELIGICGGFQMLGHAVADPHGLEGEPGSSGLGLTTELVPAQGAGCLG